MASSSSKKPKAIIFDCWNTLFYIDRRYNPLIRIARNLVHRERSYALLKIFEDAVMKKPQGEVEAAKNLIRANRVPLTRTTLRVAERILVGPNRNRKPFPDTLDGIKRLKKEGFKLGLVTNTYDLVFEPLRKKYELDDLFDAVVPSYEAEVIKPDPEIFRIALKKLKIKPEEALMVGDNWRDDILGAEVAGIKGVLMERYKTRSGHKPSVTSIQELEKYLT
jgi:HAD superfamily hydrolase (TIGR01549 family)